MSGIRSAVALGANLGNPTSTLTSAVQNLSNLGTVVATSPLYRTAPVGGPTGQPDYVNQVALLHVPEHISAAEFLRKLHLIEAKHGRERTEHWGARTLDLDLLWFGNETSAQSNLHLPHPRLHERAFVLVPLVAAMRQAGWTWQHPLLGTDPATLLAALPASELADVHLVGASF